MSERIEFTKMQGAGNDYVYVNCMERMLQNPASAAQQLADRHFGVGGDGLVLICSSDVASAEMRMFNPDGSEAQNCGNALRCVSRYLFDQGLVDDTRFKIETGAGVLEAEVHLNEDNVVTAITVDMGRPILEPRLVPVDHEGEAVIAAPFPFRDRELQVTVVSMGNPHAVFFVSEITDEMVLDWGSEIETHAWFPENTNVEFARVIDPDTIEMRVWERGAGETLACGTGAAAVAVASNLNGFTKREVTVRLLGGDLRLVWRSDDRVEKTGPAEYIFSGTVTLPLPRPRA